MYKIVYTKQAVKDIEKLKSTGLADKARNLIDIIRVNPFEIPPPYEKLVGNLEGYCSWRINLKHRLVYEVLAEEKMIKIIRMWSHYGKVK